MNSIFNYLLESGFALGAFSLFYLLALKQEKAFVFNRFYLLGSVFLSLLLPMIQFRVAGVPSNLVAGTIILETLELNATEAASIFIPYALWLYVYIVIVALLLFRIVRKAVPLLIARRQSITQQGYHLYSLKNSSEAYTFWDTIYLGDQLDEGERDIILSHEVIHAREKHSLDILILEILSVILWINPIFLLVKKLARTNHEYLADAKAINLMNKKTYVQTLASHAIKKSGFVLAHAFYTSSTLKRIKMINQQNNQIMKIKQIVPFVLGLALVIVFGCEDAAEQLSSMDDQAAATAIAQAQTSSVKKAEGMDGVYDMVDVQPGPNGGMTAFYQWVAETMEYPTQARKDGIEGRVFVQFIVNEKGDITDVKSIKGIGAGCDAEAVRVMKTAAKWTPGLVDDKPVKVRMIMPVSFKLRG
ncbi:M56 family metallopeptidase [Reichenbachiella faecimaris]|nr:M56 family metallopeptidase [Reichenbachiella faecimaris]